MPNSVAETQAEVLKLYQAYRGTMTDEEALKRAVADVAIKDLPPVPGTNFQEAMKEIKKIVKRWSAWAGGIIGYAVSIWASYKAGQGVDITKLPPFQFALLAACGGAIFLLSRKNGATKP